MTPEEKAKRYNEALDRAKIAHKDEDRHLKATLERIFPELKESNDEKIRKTIIDIIKSLKEQQCHHIYDVMYDKMIAWLEKQGRHTNFRNKIRIGDKVTRNENGELVNLSQLKRVAKEYNITGIGSKNAQGKLGEMIKRKLEMDKQSDKSQGKSVLEAINEEKVDNANKVEPKDYSSIDPHFWKSIDKVKPKFHEGQWIVWQGKYFKVNYNGCGYELTDQNGKSTSLEYGAVDKTANPWVIQDAKAGDVLAEDSCIFIIQKLGDNSTAAKTYCTLYDDGDFDDGSILYFDIDSTKPATKEQCDTLEKAIANAGYTFDFEKKELKKIEDEIEIPYGAKDSELIEESYNIPKGFHAEIDGDKVVIKKGEKPIEWSEDDKYWSERLLGWLDVLINYIHEDKTVSIDLRRERMQQIELIKTWFTSLKYRIHPKNDYNPYKEVVESITKMCERYDKYSHSILKDFFNNVKAKCKDAKEFDSLHPQNTKTISQ